jgi:membrane protein implicated in regulation of membrane protease activity
MSILFLIISILLVVLLIFITTSGGDLIAPFIPWLNRMAQKLGAQDTFDPTCTFLYQEAILSAPFCLDTQTQKYRGRVDFQGTTWSAESADNLIYEQKAPCRVKVIGIDGLTLKVEKVL